MGAVGISETQGGYWAESRPDEGGRTVIVGPRLSGREPGYSDQVGSAANVRTRVHEYGGGAWWPSAPNGFARFMWVDFADQRVRLTTDDGLSTLTPDTDGKHRYADGRSIGYWSVCVRERHEGAGEPANELVAIETYGEDVRLLWSGADFVSSPRVSPDLSKIAFISWDHPEMPWTRTRLHVHEFDPSTSGPSIGQELVCLDGDRAFCEPGWVDDRLMVVVDDDEWWNLFEVDVANGSLAPIVTGPFDIATPPWVFGMQRWAALPMEGRDPIIVAVATLPTGDELIIDGKTVQLVDSSITSLSTVDDTIWYIGAGFGHEAEVVSLKLENGRPQREVVRPSRTLPFDRGLLVEPEWITYPTGPDGDATAHALFYPPTNPAHVGPVDERPPLLVLAHGGPTAQARRQLQTAILYWTSRGIAVVDVDYRGSTGYGRSYRQALDGRWGIADVEDCVAAASFLASRGDVDPERLMIRGGSAGGFTVLSALAFHDTFAVGASRYGVADLEALATETHKFEARYLDSLVGPYPAERATYIARSPIHHVEQISAPMIVLQGDEDEIVPPNQSEMIVDALRANDIKVEYLLFEGEQHGFRKAENIVTALEAELAFFGEVLGFTPHDPSAAG